MSTTTWPRLARALEQLLDLRGPDLAPPVRPREAGDHRQVVAHPAAHRGEPLVEVSARRPAAPPTAAPRPRRGSRAAGPPHRRRGRGRPGPRPSRGGELAGEVRWRRSSAREHRPGPTRPPPGPAPSRRPPGRGRAPPGPGRGRRVAPWCRPRPRPPPRRPAASASSPEPTTAAMPSRWARSRTSTSLDADVRHRDRAHAVAPQVRDRRRVQPGASRDTTATSACPLDTAASRSSTSTQRLSTTTPGAGLEVGEGRRLPGLARGHDEHADHDLTPGRRPARGRPRWPRGRGRGTRPRRRGPPAPAAGWSRRRRSRRRRVRRARRCPRAPARQPHRPARRRRASRSPITQTSTREPRTTSGGTCSAATATETATASSSVASPSAAAGTSSPAASGAGQRQGGRELVVDGEVALDGPGRRRSGPASPRGRRRSTVWPATRSVAADQTCGHVVGAGEDPGPGDDRAGDEGDADPQPRVAPARTGGTRRRRHVEAAGGAGGMARGVPRQDPRHGAIIATPGRVHTCLSTGTGRSATDATASVAPWPHGRRPPLPDARRRGRGAQHLERAGLRARPSRRPPGDQDRRPRPVARRAGPARGVHPADVRRDAHLRRPAPLRRGGRRGGPGHGTD